MYGSEHNPISRQLSASSFLTDNPACCWAWMQDIGGTPRPTRGPREYGRVQTSIGGTIVVYRDGLVIVTASERMRLAIQRLRLAIQEGAHDE